MAKIKEKRVIDWERIEQDYRAGILSVREIAASQGITHGAINKRVKRDGWDRDLSKRIQAKADALVSKSEVSTLVSKVKADTDRAIVEAGAEVVATIRLTQRKDIGRARELAMALLEELEAETKDGALFKELGEMLRCEDERGNDKRNDLYMKIIGSPTRIDSIKKLSETLKNLISLEREAYNIVDVTDNQDIKINVFGGLPEMPRS